MSIDPSPRLALALVLLVALTMLAARAGRFGILRSVPVAAVRAVVQLFAVSFLVVAAVTRLWAAALFVLAMFVVVDDDRTGPEPIGADDLGGVQTVWRSSSPPARPR